MRVFLVHGMARTPMSMTLLGHRLQRAGFTVEYFGYSVTFERLDRIADRLVRKVASLVGTRGTPYAIVGHSLGNIITRMAADALPPGFTRFAMLAPPNHSPKLARQLKSNTLYRLFTGDAGQRLSDTAFYADLPVPDVETLIVAGTAGPRKASLPLGDAANDGIVRLDEAVLDNVPAVEVPALHTFVMNRRDVAATVIDFLAPARDHASQS